MAFLFLYIVCNILIIQGVRLIIISFTRSMPWYVSASYLVIGAAVGSFAWIIAIFSLATFLGGIK